MLRKLLLLASVAAALAVAITAPALAQAVSSALGSSAPPSTDVAVPVGSWFADAVPLITAVAGILLSILLGFAIKLLPPWAQALATPAVKAEAVSLAADAINWGVQAVAGAAKGKELDINVGNAVVAAAAQQALNTWPAAVIAKLGGADGVKQWIITQLEDHGVILPDSSTAAAVIASAPVTAVK